MGVKGTLKIDVMIDTDAIKELLGYWACASDTWYNCIEYAPEAYQKAKDTLVAANSDTTICYEDILYQMLVDGGTLGFTDSENYDTYTLRLADIADGVVKAIWDYDTREWLEWADDDSKSLTVNAAALDGEWADIILQEALMGDVIFG